MVAARMGAENNTATAPVGRTRRARSSSAGALLPPRLLATAAHLSTRERVRGALPHVRLLRYHGLMQHHTVWLDAEDPVVQRDRADGRARCIPYRYVHQADPLAFMTVTRPPDAPGTAPFTASSPRSASVARTSRFFTVTRSFPMRPAIRVPFSTRPGVVPAPIDPAARQRSDWPWVLGPPWKP